MEILDLQTDSDDFLKYIAKNIDNINKMFVLKISRGPLRLMTDDFVREDEFEIKQFLKTGELVQEDFEDKRKGIYAKREKTAFKKTEPIDTGNDKDNNDLGHPVNDMDKMFEQNLLYKGKAFTDNNTEW